MLNLKKNIQIFAQASIRGCAGLTILCVQNFSAISDLFRNSVNCQLLFALVFAAGTILACATLKFANQSLDQNDTDRQITFLHSLATGACWCLLYILLGTLLMPVLGQLIFFAFFAGWCVGTILSWANFRSIKQLIAKHEVDTK